MDKPLSRGQVDAKSTALSTGWRFIQWIGLSEKKSSFELSSGWVSWARHLHVTLSVPCPIQEYEVNWQH